MSTHNDAGTSYGSEETPTPLDQRSGSFRVIHPYVPQHDGEVELSVGDCVTNAKDLSNGWTVGRNLTSQAVGIFPSACVVQASLLTQEPDQQTDDSLWYDLDRLSAISTEDIDRNSQLFSIGEGLPPPPDVTEHTIQDPGEDNRQNKTLQNTRKPQMSVKPNPSKNLFISQSGDLARRPPSDMSANTGGVPEPPTVWCHQGSIPHIAQTLPTQTHPSNTHRMTPNELDDGRQRYIAPRCATPAPSRHNSQPNLLRSSRPSIDANIDNTERQNVTNETLNNNNSAQNIPLSLTAAQIAEIKRSRYYQDYRTLECPPDDEEELVDEITAPHMQPQYQYKPILKKRSRQNDAYPPEGGRGQEIYYADGSQPHVEDERPKSLRLVISVLCGLLSGFVLFLWMYHALRYSFIVALIAGTILVALGSIAFAASRLCRCVGAILLPSICTTRGRLAFLILIGGFILDGAVTNIYQNMEEVSRSMACSTEQSYNQSMLLLQPFDAMMTELNTTVERLQRASTDIGHSLRPLQEGLDQMEMDLYTGELELTGTARVRIRAINLYIFDKHICLLTQ